MTIDIATLALKVDATQPAQASKELDKLTQSGKRTEDQAKKTTAETEKLGKAAAGAAKDVDRLASSSERAANATKQAGDKARAAGEELGRAATSIARGTAGMDEAAAVARTLGIGVTAVGAAFGLAAYGIVKYQSELDKLNALSAGIGRYAGLTGAQLQEVAIQGARAGSVTVGAAREMAVELAKTGRIGGEMFTGLIGIQRDYARAMGVDSKQATRELAQSFSDPARGALDLNAKLGLLDYSTLHYIETLTAANRTTEAQSVLLQALQSDIGGTSERLGGLGHAWDEVRSAASQAGSVMLDALKTANALMQLGPQAFALKAQAEREADERRTRTAINQASVAAGQIVSALNPDQARLEQLQAQRSVVGAGILAAGAEGNAEELRRNQEAYSNLTRAIDSYLPSAEKAHRLAVLDTELAKAKTAAERGRLAAEKARVQASGEVVSAAEVETRATDAAGLAAARTKTHVDRHAESLVREAQAMTATTAATLGLARAYDVSAAEALRQEARVDAVGKAIRRKGDVDAFVQRQLDLNAAKAAADASKQVFAMNAEVKTRIYLNEQVAAGAVTAAEANEILRQSATLRALEAQAEVESGQAKALLLQRIKDLKVSQADLNAVTREAQIIEDTRRIVDANALLSEEAKLIGAGNRERAVRLAQLRAEQELRGRGETDLSTPTNQAYIRGQMENAGAGVDLKTANDNYNASLGHTLELLTQIDDQARRAGAGLSSAFGAAGEAINGVATALSGYALRQEEIARKQEDLIRNAIARDPNGDLTAESAKRISQIQILAARDAKDAQLDYYASVAGAAKGFFGQQTAAYKALQAAEVAYRAIEMALALKAAFTKSSAAATSTAAVLAGQTVEVGAVATAEAAKTAATATGTAVRTPMKIAEGAASMFASLGPFGFAAVGAMLAVMASLGFSKSGSGGGLGYDPKALQDAAGTGTVLGDPSAKSASLTNSLKIAESYQNKDLEYSNQMVRSLRSIDSQMGAVAAAIARTLGAGGALDTSALGLGTTTSGPGGLTKALNPLSWVAPALFGSTTTRTLADQGLLFSGQTIADILANGVDASTYQSVSSQTKKKFLGVTYSDKTSTSTTNTPLDDDLARQIALLIGSVRGGVVEAAKVLGLDGAQAVIDAFALNIGRVSLKDLSGQALTDALNAIFSKAADQMASAVVPAAAQFQKVGEGLFETLTRLARDYQVVDVSLQSIGKTFGAVGVESLTARERLIDLAGGIEDLADKTQAYAEAFLTDAERLAPVQKAVAAEMQRLGLASVTTKDQFKTIVQGLDLTTQAGAEMYASLLNVAPAFAKVADAAAEAAQKATEAALGAANDMLDKARGDLSDARDREASALKSTVDSLTAIAKNLDDYAKTLSPAAGVTGSPLARYRATRGAFESTSAAAQAGDQAALGQLQSVSQQYLEAAKAVAPDARTYAIAMAQVRTAVTNSAAFARTQASIAQQQLDALNKQVDALLGINQSVLSVREAITAFIAASVKQNATQAAYSQATGGAVSSDLPAGFDWRQYATDNPDLLAARRAGTALTEFGSDEEAVKQHYLQIGRYEIAAGTRYYASGGDHMGGWRVVGEEGRELEATGPARYFSASQTRQILGGGDNHDVVSAIRSLDARLARIEANTGQTAKHADSTQDTLKRATQGKNSFVTRDVAAA